MNFQTYFFHYLVPEGVFQRFANFHITCNQGVLLITVVFGKQNAIAAGDGYDDRRRTGRICAALFRTERVARTV